MKSAQENWDPTFALPTSEWMTYSHNQTCDMKCIYCDMNGIKESSSYGMQTVIIPTIIQKYDEGIRGQLTSTKIAGSSYS